LYSLKKLFEFFKIINQYINMYYNFERKKKIFSFSTSWNYISKNKKRNIYENKKYTIYDSFNIIHIFSLFSLLLKKFIKFKIRKIYKKIY